MKITNLRTVMVNLPYKHWIVSPDIRTFGCVLVFLAAVVILLVVILCSGQKQVPSSRAPVVDDHERNRVLP